MRTRNIMRAVLFVLFFGIGAASLSSAILCDDLVQYYQNKDLLRQAHESLSRLKSLNADYDVLLKRLEEDPNLFRRLAPDPAHRDANTAYPRVTAEQLAATRRALMKDPNQSAAGAMPKWLSRASKPSRRIMLFVCGVVLILTSFVCFRPVKPNAK